jgi:2-polyprenyl-6-methoxyphenol hydroxylase-like FAD-dependent oxidoreductase
MKVLVSGASIAGPVLAYWLTRYGHQVTVVERKPALRKTGGHAIDLFRPAMEISERMGLLPQIEARDTGTTTARQHREGAARPVTLDLRRIEQAVSDRHVEIMRDELGEIFYSATAGEVEYLFDDSITSITEHGEVTFERQPARRFDVIVGADGLRSNVRRLTFGPQAAYTKFLGAYVGVFSAPQEMADNGVMDNHLGPGRMALIYSAKHLPDARVLLFFRSAERIDYHHRDQLRQQEILRAAFAGMHPQVDSWLGELDRTPNFYFDAVDQLQLTRWSRGRVTLVGDAGYCPGPAVGGSTSLAVVGAYVLAGELAAAEGDHQRAFAAYEREMIDLVQRHRAFARRAAKTLVPDSVVGVNAAVQVGRLFTALPVPIARVLAGLGSTGVRVLDSAVVKDYSQLEARDGS